MRVTQKPLDGKSVYHAESARMNLTQAREQRGWTIERVAAAVGLHGTTVARIERGQLLPSREHARALYQLFGGDVPLGSIYDPSFKAAEVATRKRKNGSAHRQRQ